MFRRPFMLEAKMSAISDRSAQPSTTGTWEVDLCFSRFTADQKSVFFLFVNDLASLSQVNWFCLRFKRRTEDLYFLLVLFLTSDRAPVGGQPASLQTLYQKSASCFRSLHESFQPTKVREEDRAGRQRLAQAIKVETSLSAYSSSSVLCCEQAMSEHDDKSIGSLGIHWLRWSQYSSTSASDTLDQRVLEEQEEGGEGV